MVAQHDETCLRDHYDVRTFRIRIGQPPVQVVNLLHLTLWLTWNLPRAFGVFFRFADTYAAIPTVLCRLLRKKLWIVLGGYDSHWFPEVQYGVYGSTLRRACVRYAVRNATALLPVHESLYNGVNTYAFDSPRNTGVESLVPGIRGDVRTLHNGFDPGFWIPDPSKQKEPIVVTVATVPHLSSLAARTRMARLKGLHTLAATAQLLPETTFVVVGVDEPALPPELLPLPKNVLLTGRISLEEVRTWYQRAQVYAHPSLTEGMPNAVAEAMLCECVPVGSNANGTPTLIGETGFILQRPDPVAWAEAIRSALVSTSGSSARRRIVEHFNVNDRCTRLVEIVRP